MTDILLTISQALQLVALAPCIFVVAFLLCSARRNGDNIVPILYFLSLGCSFIIPLLVIFGDIGNSAEIKALLMLGESTTAAFSFLLVIQFLNGRIPKILFWMILAIPLIGGSPFIYATLFAAEVCMDTRYCLPTDALRVLYGIFSAALIFLLLIVQFARSNSRIAVDDIDRKHKYWLIIALVMLNLSLVFLDLMQVAQRIRPADALLISTVIRIAFIYLVLTSIFRVFYDLFDIELLAAAGKGTRNPEQDKQTVDRIRTLLEHEHIYREMGLSRESLSKQLGISEHQTSRIVNAYFGKNFNELVNDYRIREAKERLLIEEDTQVTVIAFEVGFNSIASFNRVFKEIVGASPSEYRAFHKNSPK